jgi:hypothetical protein
VTTGAAGVNVEARIAIVGAGTFATAEEEGGGL